MEWFNIYGFAIVIVIMIPNIIFAIKCKDGFENLYQNKFVEIFEQAGRYGCFGFMIFSIPETSFGFASDKAFEMYLTVDSVLLIFYCIIWIVCFRKDSFFKAVFLSVIPSFIFLFSGVLSRSVLLIIAAVIFAPCHILISCKNYSIKSLDKK